MVALYTMSLLMHLFDSAMSMCACSYSYNVVVSRLAFPNYACVVACDD